MDVFRPVGRFVAGRMPSGRGAPCLSSDEPAYDFLDVAELMRSLWRDPDAACQELWQKTRMQQADRQSL